MAGHDGAVTANRGLGGAANHRGAAHVGLILVIIAVALALTSDVPRTGTGLRGTIKGDEATYVSAALSAAFDTDLRYERGDVERFEQLYHSGPEGIFLQRGRHIHVAGSAAFPFVHITGTPEVRTDRLYFGKALLYPIAAAPFVRLFGLRGFLLFHVALLACAAACGYFFLAARASSLVAMTFTLAFLGASALPAYTEFFAPELLNFTLVFVAYFLWLYKHVSRNSRLTGAGPEIVAAVLLALVTYSKPTNIPLIAPLVLFACWRRQWIRATLLSGAFLAVVAIAFSFNAAVSGEFNYQGGDRRTFYGTFPFENTGTEWRPNAPQAATDGSAAREVLTSPELPARFVTNLEYFLIGRHFGFIPYCFPGAVAIVIWLLSPARRDAWRLLTFAGFAGTAVVLLLIMPFTWSGGGGPIGNRYLVAAYPVLFFLIPPTDTLWPAIVAWAGGALFTAKILVNPIAATTYPFLTTELGPARLLPVELTMANDLPVMLAQPPRARMAYGQNPTLLLYFLDRNAFPPEPPGVWVASTGRADIIVRSPERIHHLAMEAESPIETSLRVSMGRGSVTVKLRPGETAKFDLPVRGVREWRGFAYLLTASAAEGFVPRLRDAASPDYRSLGAVIRFSAVTAAASTAPD